MMYYCVPKRGVESTQIRFYKVGISSAGGKWKTMRTACFPVIPKSPLTHSEFFNPHFRLELRVQKKLNVCNIQHSNGLKNICSTEYYIFQTVDIGGGVFLFERIDVDGYTRPGGIDYLAEGRFRKKSKN